MSKRRSRQKGRKPRNYGQSSSFSPDSDTETSNTSLDSCDETSTPETEHGRRHPTRKISSNGLNVTHTVNNRFCRVVDYRTFQLANSSTKYDCTLFEDISKVAKQMMVEMKPHTLDPFDPIAIIGFLCISESASDTNGTNESATR